MMMRPIAVLVTIAGLFTSPLAHAQEVPAGAFRKELVASGVLMRPLGDFQRALGTIAYGGGAHWLGAIGSGRVSAGVDSHLMFYARGWSEHHEMILTVHGLVRLSGSPGPRRPYVEGLAGIKGFSMDSRIGTSSYGVGVGMQFPLARSGRYGPTEREIVEIGVRYFRGGAARVDDQLRARSTHGVTVHVGWGLQF